jgi:DNA-3-methyladenine glycosylase
MVLVRALPDTSISGIIVETEAYRGKDDPASHAFKGKTPRNAVMFGPPGHAYVYFTYGFHYCLNVTTEKTGIPGAVLVRALQPVDGIGSMKKNRAMDDIFGLASGPGKLTQALGIDGRFNGEDLVASKVLYLEKRKTGGFPVANTTRVGVTAGAEFRWRFYVEGSPFVSKGRPAGTESTTARPSG